MQNNIVVLPSGTEVKAGFVNEAMRQWNYRLANGRPLIDYTDWSKLTDMKRHERIGVGANLLLATCCNGDREMLSSLITQANQNICVPFLQAFVDPELPNYPDWHPSGIQSSFLSSKLKATITFHAGDGLPWMEVEGRQLGGMVAVNMPGKGMVPYALPDGAHAIVRGCVQLADRTSGQLVVIDQPSYFVDVSSAPKLLNGTEPLSTTMVTPT